MSCLDGVLLSPRLVPHSEGMCPGSSFEGRAVTLGAVLSSEAGAAAVIPQGGDGDSWQA